MVAHSRHKLRRFESERPFAGRNVQTVTLVFGNRVEVIVRNDKTAGVSLRTDTPRLGHNLIPQRKTVVRVHYRDTVVTGNE